LAWNLARAKGPVFGLEFGSVFVPGQRPGDALWFYNKTTNKKEKKALCVCVYKEGAVSKCGADAYAKD
jgi:uncharacterized protein (DUF427 family)